MVGGLSSTAPLNDTDEHSRVTGTVTYRTNWCAENPELDPAMKYLAFGRTVLHIFMARSRRSSNPAAGQIVSMKISRYIYALAVLAMSCWWLHTAEPTVPAQASPGDTEQATQMHHGPSRAAPVIFELGPLPVTNSMLVSWVVTLGLVIFARVATRRIQRVPNGLQNFWEWLVELLFGFLESIMGRQLSAKTFWFFAAIFVFILASNWFGLLPGIGSVGYGHQTAHGFVVTEPLMRGATADLNLTLAMASVFFVMWFVWAIQANGLKGFVLHLFGPKGDLTGALRILLGFVFFLVGILEVVSILFRPISLSFRLYGNIFAGENMLERMITLMPMLSWLIPLPFYMLEVLVGLVQAMVFMLLTAVFTMTICLHEGEDQH